MENNKSVVDIGEVVPLPKAEGTPANQNAGGDPSTAEEGLFSSKQPPVALEELGRLFSSRSMAVDAFDWHTALSLIVASKLVYYEGDTVESTVKNAWKLDSCEFISVNNSQCFIAASGDNVLVTFRGTEDLADWMDNASIFPTTRAYGKIHSGFYNNFNALRQKLEAALTQLAPSKVLLTGHSLGGALATVAAAEWNEAYPISGVYTYGQPAVGRGDFRALFRTRYSDNFYRFINDDDIVTRVPPNYRHVGKRLHFNKAGMLKSKSPLENAAGPFESVESTESVESESDEEMMSEAEFEEFRAQLASPLEGILPSVSDHTIDIYIRKIQAQVQ